MGNGAAKINLKLGYNLCSEQMNRSKMSFLHIVRKITFFGRGSVEQKSENYQEQPVRIFDAEVGTVIFSLSQDTVNKLKPFWSHLCLSEQWLEVYNKERSAENDLPGLRY